MEVRPTGKLQLVVTLKTAEWRANRSLGDTSTPDYSDKEYGRQTPDGKILCGGFRRLDADEGLGHEVERVSAPVLAGIARCLTTLFPVLRGVRVARAWAGIMGFTADGLPLIGRYPAAPGLTVAAGFNGGGFSWAAIVGRVVADLLEGRDAGFDLAPFDPYRFATRGTAWANPFTAGERSRTLEDSPVGGAITTTAG
jgi:glycine/D-amino acid oxidase-like deaminating enzyme